MKTKDFDPDELNCKLREIIDFLKIEDDLASLNYSKEHLVKILSLCNERMLHVNGTMSKKLEWLNEISVKSIHEKRENIPSVPEALFLVYLKLLDFLNKNSCPDFAKFTNHDTDVLSRASERIRSAIEKPEMNVKLEED